jgi:hypothetical protein
MTDRSTQDMQPQSISAAADHRCCGNSCKRRVTAASQVAFAQLTLTTSLTSPAPPLSIRSASQQQNGFKFGFRLRCGRSTLGQACCQPRALPLLRLYLWTRAVPSVPASTQTLQGCLPPHSSFPSVWWCLGTHKACQDGEVHDR